MPLYPSNKVPLKKMRGKECRWNLHVENKYDSSAGAVLGVLLRRPLIDTPPPPPPLAEGSRVRASADVEYTVDFATIL